jgi:hypothetical protein
MTDHTGDGTTLSMREAWLAWSQEGRSELPDDFVLSMQDIADMWGMKKKSVQALRFRARHGHPESFPCHDRLLSNMPVWSWKTIREFERPRHR